MQVNDTHALLAGFDYRRPTKFVPETTTRSGLRRSIVSNAAASLTFWTSVTSLVEMSGKSEPYFRCISNQTSTNCRPTVRLAIALANNLARFTAGGLRFGMFFENTMPATSATFEILFAKAI